MDLALKDFMTDRYYALTVILEKDIRSDDAQPMIEAIKMIKGVLDIKPHITTPTELVANHRAKMELTKKIMDMIWDHGEQRT